MALRWPGHRLAGLLALAVILIWLLVMATVIRSAALDPGATGKMLVVFDPGTTQESIFEALVAAGGRPVRATWLPFVWVVVGKEAGLAGRLIESGALGAYG